MYCALEDVKELCQDSDLVQLTNDDPEAKAINTAKVDSAMSSASEVVDGYLRGRYKLPLPITSKLLKKLAVDLTIYELYRRRFSGEMPETVKESQKTALKMLEQIQKGVMSLGIEKNETVSPAKFKTNKTPEDRLFGKDLLKTY